MKKQLFSVLHLFLVAPPVLILILRLVNYYSAVYVNQEVNDASFILLALILTYVLPFFILYVVIYYILMFRYNYDRRLLVTYLLLFVLFSVLSVLSILLLTNPANNLDD